jgi:hypothetical protein
VAGQQRAAVLHACTALQGGLGEAADLTVGDGRIRPGLAPVAAIHNKWLLMFSMVGAGGVWASTLAMPYCILAGSLPAEKTGIYMGIFKVNNRLLAVVAGGVFFVVAAVLMLRVRDVGVERVADGVEATRLA